MLKRILLAVIFTFLALPLIVLAIAATRPATYLVQRSISVAAPPGAVYAEVADFHRWDRWSPWTKLDLKQQNTLTGEGLGSVFAWSGDAKVGAGRLTIIEAVPGSKVGIKMEFLRPWESTSELSFLVVPEGGGSRLTWLMKGNHGFVGRAASAFVDMDKLLGPDFEKGLAAIKADLERPGR